MCREEGIFEVRLTERLTAELERKADCQETCAITINLLRVIGNGCDSVGHARTNRRQDGCGRGSDIDER